MNHRRFVATLFALHSWAVPMPSAPVGVLVARDPLLRQESPLAGFQYHAGRRVWRTLQVGQPHELRLEPDNHFDPRAAAAYWREHKLGYLPRRENEAATQLLDRRVVFAARIVRLRQSEDARERLRLAVNIPAHAAS